MPFLVKFPKLQRQKPARIISDGEIKKQKQTTNTEMEMYFSCWTPNFDSVGQQLQTKEIFGEKRNSRERDQIKSKCLEWNYKIFNANVLNTNDNVFIFFYFSRNETHATYQQYTSNQKPETVKESPALINVLLFFPFSWMFQCSPWFSLSTNTFK